MKPEGGEIILGERRISFTVARSKRRRSSVAFVMENPSALKIIAPMRSSLSTIRSVIERQTNWIKRRLVEFQKVPARIVPTQNYREGESVQYLGYSFQISIVHDKNLRQGCMLLRHRLVVNFPSDEQRQDAQCFGVPLPLAGGVRGGQGVRHTSRNSSFGTSPPSVPPASGREALTAETCNQQSEDIRLEILLWLKKRAKVKFQKRMDMWAARLGVRYQKMVIANAERRWGSCSVDDVIRLSWRLIMAPLPILDYVIVHELSHVKNKNHGPQFWAQVASVMPDYKNRRKHLRLIGGGLVL